MLCRIGAVEIWRILELHEPFLLPSELFPNAGPDVGRIIESLVPGALCPESGRVIFPFQGFLLKTPSHVILIDSCIGNDKTLPNRPSWHRRSDNRFEAALTAAGVAFDEIDYVLCTHLHADHTGWNTRLLDGRWVPSFPKARYLMPAADERHFRDLASNTYSENVLPVIEADQAELISDGHMLGDNVTLIPTPGHTPGHVSVVVRDGGHEAVITGDALHTTAQCRHPEWHFMSDADPQTAVDSRSRLLERMAEARCLVLGTHFALPSIGSVSAANGGFRWNALAAS